MMKSTSILGYILLAAYLVQLIFPFQWEPLYSLQQDEMYKRWSGLGLLVFIAIQWILTLYRIRKKGETSSSMLDLHKWMGALSPVVFYIHTMSFGAQYLLILSITFFFNFFLGLLNVAVIKSMNQTLYKWWYMTHIFCSLIITLFSFYHIWIVFYYE